MTIEKKIVEKCILMKLYIDAVKTVFFKTVFSPQFNCQSVDSTDLCGISFQSTKKTACQRI